MDMYILNLEANYDSVRSMLNLPVKNKLLVNGGILNLDDIQKINKKILLSFKFYLVPQDLPITFDLKFPTVENQSFNDIKYLKKTNETVK